MADPIEVEGLRALTAQLKALNPELVAKLKATSKDAASLVAADATRHAPDRTGALIATIRASGTTRGGKVMAGSARRAPYGPIVHFGAVRDASSHRRRNIPANPFLYAALDRRRQDVVQRFALQVQRVIEQVD